jgi:hypothetical protein
MENLGKAKENIKSVERSLNGMGVFKAWKELHSGSTVQNRLGLIFTCINSMAGVRKDGFLGDIEAVKDAVVKSDGFINQRHMIIKEYLGFGFILSRLFFAFDLQRNTPQHKTPLEPE